MDTTHDARNRAWRTFVQGLAVDILAALVLAVGPALMQTDGLTTRAYWSTMGALVLKTVVTAVVSYIARKVIPPPA
jgi:hypothetical protein